MNQLSIVAILLVGLTVAFAQMVGVAQIQGTELNDGATGTVTFTQINDTYVRVHVSISGIAHNLDALHGIHVHQYGDLQNKTTGGASVGGHFVGAGQSVHACEDTDERHEGDMGNWQVDADGNIEAEKELNLLTLTGDNSIIGLAVVVHNLTDNCYNITSAGKRLAWGVIGIANVNGNTASNSKSATRASCILTSTTVPSAAVTGSIFFEPASGGIRVFGFVNGLTKGSSHGFHVHQYGDITNSTGSAAGGHYNPNNVNHALAPATTRHVGDLPNLETYDSEGRAWFDYVSELIALEGDKSVIGRAIIVHEKADDGCTQPTGAAGNRYAQCVIGVSAQDNAYWAPPAVAVSVPAPKLVTCTPAGPNTSMAVQQAVGLLFLSFVLLALVF